MRRENTRTTKLCERYKNMVIFDVGILDLLSFDDLFIFSKSSVVVSNVQRQTGAILQDPWKLTDVLI